MAASYEERLGAPWWLVVAAGTVMLIAVPAPLIGWFGVPVGTALAVAAVVAALQTAVALGTSTSIQVVDGLLRTRSALVLGPLEFPLGRGRHLPVTAVRGARLLQGQALKDVRRRLTSAPLREALYGDRIGYEPGNVVGFAPGRPSGLHLAVTGADGRPQEWLIVTHDAVGFLQAVGHPTPPPILEDPPVPLPDGSLPPPDPLDAFHPRERARRRAAGSGRDGA